MNIKDHFKVNVRKVTKIGLIVVTVGIAAFVFFFGLLLVNNQRFEGKISQRIDSMFVTIANKTYVQTYSQDTTEELRREVAIENFVKIGDMISSNLGELKSKTLRKFTCNYRFSGRVIDVTYDGIFENGQGEIVASLKQADGDWKFSTFHVRITKMTDVTASRQ